MASKDPRAGLRFHPAHRGAVERLHYATRLYERLGVEASVDDVARALRDFVQGFRAPVVGGLYVGCSDEAEIEGPEAFQRHFVRYLLPSVKPTLRSAFLTSNLGGRYEWRSGRLAEGHFADVRGAENGKCVALKINAHVGVVDEGGAARFGHFVRFGAPSPACGALTATLESTAEPFAQDVARALRAEDVDRLSTLRGLDERHRLLFAAACHARLMARRATIDLQDHVAGGPTVYVVLACVTLNRTGHDTEIPIGLYVLDRREGEPHDEYCGLGDRPDRYRVGEEHGRITLVDGELERPRRARDHRRLVVETWRRAHADAPLPEPMRVGLDEARYEESVTHGAHLAKPLLAALVGLALEFSPVPAAVVLFGEGLVGVWRAADAHRLARAANDDELARAMLREVQGRIDELPPERADHVVRLLLQAYKR